MTVQCTSATASAYFLSQENFVDCVNQFKFSDQVLQEQVLKHQFYSDRIQQTQVFQDKFLKKIDNQLDLDMSNSPKKQRPSSPPEENFTIDTEKYADKLTPNNEDSEVIKKFKELIR